jgi:hypothetical protein
MLKEGDVIELVKGHRVYTTLPHHCIYENNEGNFKESDETDITIGDVCGGLSTLFLTGKYIVDKTTTDGGGTGHGPHDVYPSGHHVFCHKVGHDHTRVNFYQSGCFTAMITDIEPIGRAKATWTVE